MSEAKMGAKVMYCGHEGWFVADIWRIENVNVVVANGPVSPDNINRTELKDATHHMGDFPKAGYWNPKKGIFVVPHKQVSELKKKK